MWSDVKCLDVHNRVVGEQGQVMVKIRINTISCGDVKYDYFFSDAQQRCCFAKVRFAPAYTETRKLPPLSEPGGELHHPEQD